MPSIVLKHGAVELTDDTFSISDNFKPTERNYHILDDDEIDNAIFAAASKKETADNIVLLDDDEEEKEATPYVFPTLSEKENEYAENDSEDELQDADIDEKPAPKQPLPHGAESLKKMCDEMLEKTVAQASAILNDAHSKAQEDYGKLIEQGRAEAEKAKAEAYSLGLAEGAREQAAIIRDCIESLEQTVARIEGKQEERLYQCEQDIRWLALEIAQKIMCEKIEENELSLYPLVTQAVAKQRGASSITVEISENAPQLLQKLRAELEKGDESIKITQASAALGTCRIQTPDGFIDASLYRQIENLRDYFSAQPAETDPTA